MHISGIRLVAGQIPVPRGVEVIRPHGISVDRAHPVGTNFCRPTQIRRGPLKVNSRIDLVTSGERFAPNPLFPRGGLDIETSARYLERSRSSVFSSARNRFS